MTTDSIARLLRERIRESVDLASNHTDESFLRTIEETVFQHAGERYLTARERHAVVRSIYNSFRGLDVLQPLIDDPTVTEIMVNGCDEIFVERAGKIERYEGAFESSGKLEDVIQTIVARVNRVVNESTPIVDARLADGSRVNVVLPPVALKGPAMTIRKFPPAPLSMSELIALGAISPEASAFLGNLVRAKYNVFVGGGTGSGKTTLLNALCEFVSADERIVTIEDSAELQIRGVPNWVRLETRNANTEGRGAITIRDLIRTSLRMRPNRIIVGEVRGPEAFDMLQAMNTGHDGSLSTGHANSVPDMLSRLETMVWSGADMPVDVIRRQIVSALDIMVHVSRLRDGSRKVTEISELVGLDNGNFQLNVIYRFADRGDDSNGAVLGEICRSGSPLQRMDKLRQAGIGPGADMPA